MRRAAGNQRVVGAPRTRTPRRRAARPAALDLAGRAGNRAMRSLVQRASLTVWDGNSSSSAIVYRSGTTFVPRSSEYKTTQGGKVKPTHGVSVHTDPPALEQRIGRSLGSWYELESIPDTLMIKQRGQDKKHYEVMPNSAKQTWPTVSEYTTALGKITVKSTAATFG